MAGTLSHVKIARYAVKQLQAGNADVLREIAAYLLDEHRLHETDLIIRAILEECERVGVVLADVTTTETLSDDIKAQIKKLTGASSLEIREHIDPSVLGGVRIETPTKRLDATFAYRLSQLRERKI